MINHKFILYNEIKSKDYINLEAYSEDEFIRISDEFIKNNSFIVKNINLVCFSSGESVQGLDNDSTIIEKENLIQIKSNLLKITSFYTKFEERECNKLIKFIDNALKSNKIVLHLAP